MEHKHSEENLYFKFWNGTFKNAIDKHLKYLTTSVSTFMRLKTSYDSCRRITKFQETKILWTCFEGDKNAFVVTFSQVPRTKLRIATIMSKLEYEIE